MSQPTGSSTDPQPQDGTDIDIIHLLNTLLLCPACHETLTEPTTLRCGHSLCSSHLPLPCPSCSASRPTPPVQEPGPNRVAFFPAPSVDIEPGTTPRTDVTLSRVLALFRQAQDGLPSTHPASYDDDDDYLSYGSDSDSSSDAHEVPAQRSLPAADISPPPSPLPSSSAIPTAPSTRHRSPPTPSPPSRPRKRRRLRNNAQFSKDLLNELNCEICFALLYDPVTTPCQHTFCQKCLQRSLDHSSFCPLCRQSLPGFAYFQSHAPNSVLLSILLRAYPTPYSSRRLSLLAESHQPHLPTPIFVCQLSFPGMPTLLHFFEPRYRLMLRRCLEGASEPTTNSNSNNANSNGAEPEPQEGRRPPMFGMIMNPRSTPSPGNTYGTMLEIRSVQMLPDGRSMVETWGAWRFRVVERGEVDGYLVGRVERVDDLPEESEDEDGLGEDTVLNVSRRIGTSEKEGEKRRTPSPTSTVASTSSTRPLISRITSRRPTPPPSPTIPRSPSAPSNATLLLTCHSFLRTLQTGTAPWVVQRLHNTYGPAPRDVAAFTFWVALVLPIDEAEKSKLLVVRSPRLRLRIVVGWIEGLRGDWWFGSGCVVT